MIEIYYIWTPRDSANAQLGENDSELCDPYDPDRDWDHQASHSSTSVPSCKKPIGSCINVKGHLGLWVLLSTYHRPKIDRLSSHLNLLIPLGLPRIKPRVLRRR